MNLRNVNKKIKEPNESKNTYIDVSFDYEDKKYELSFTYYDNEIEDELNYVELTENENKDYYLCLYRDDKILRVFDKKNNFSYDIVERNNDIVLDKYYPKNGVSHNYIFKDNIFYYSTSKTKEYIEGTEENFEIHKLIFDEQIDKDFILNKIKPFMQSINKEEYKNMFNDFFKLNPNNILENENFIKEVNKKYDEFIKIIIKDNIVEKNIQLII